MLYSIEQATLDVKKLQLQGDKEFSTQNFQSAHKLYREAYNKRLVYYARLNAKNSGIYRRLALALLKIGDDECNYLFPNLTEARMFAKLYIKIRILAYY